MHDPLQTAKGFIERLLKFKSPKPQEAPPTPVAQQPVFHEARPPRTIMEKSKEAGEIKALTRTVEVALVMFVLLGVVFFATYMVAKNQPLRVLQSEGDLVEQAHRFFEEDPTKAKDADQMIASLRVDNIAFFLNSVLSIKHNVSEAGAPMLPLLQGFMASDIYRDTQAAIERNLDTVKQQQMVQSFTPIAYKLVEVDEKSRRIGIAVSGKISIHAMKTKRGGPLINDVDYRALVVLEIVPKSQLNQSGLFMVSPLREVYGAKNVIAFDKEMEGKHERAK